MLLYNLLLLDDNFFLELLKILLVNLIGFKFFLSSFFSELNFLFTVLNLSVKRIKLFGIAILYWASSRSQCFQNLLMCSEFASEYIHLFGIFIKFSQALLLILDELHLLLKSLRIVEFVWYEIADRIFLKMH